ncbi:MAG TPA: hypothetical protein VFT65_02290, partial [Candidatus Angelobacter sp.]|nr:hypothetical protein [Candidatus Angelobacter sp.]
INYYHWIQGGVDFIYLDNASHILGPAQLSWFKDRIKKAEKDSAVRTLIVGMHEALPDSISTDHAMCDPDLVKRYGAKYPFQQSCDEGRQAYRALLDFQNDRPEKQVFVLASHSHYYMDGIFKIASKPVAERLRGFIVGTAGAIRYKLPDDFLLSNYAETDTYGYLLGTVDAKGDVTFQFQHVTEADVPPDVRQRYQSSFVSWCFNDNKDHPRQPAQTHDDCAKTPPAEPEATAPAKQ